jgi:AP-1 complex subunit gamma-1
MSTTGRLRELIRAVRGCKTAAEERGLIQKECASIRQAFKEGRDYSRSANMLKLLYITMLGYSTEFGQMEVVKLIAQAEYGAKRIGYLTLAVVLDETHEVLTLAENHIKRDLVNTNSFVQAIALDVVANVAGEDMARDVLHEVETLLDSPNLYLKKKASLAAVRIVKKAPDHAEIFLEKLQLMFNERNHGALLCSLTLANECLVTEQGQEMLPKFRILVTAAVRVLKQLVLSSKVTDVDIGGVSDPFLQIKLLQFLRITGTGSPAASEAMNDVLAQVATNTDASRNVGSAVHYECVKTIHAIVSDDGLRVLGINTIGRFLTSVKDNNVRFVALAMLLRLLETDVAAVQRHQATIIDCLKDADLSIRRRALDLTVALIDSGSVRILVPDLIQYLQASNMDVQSEVAEKIASVIDVKSPTPEWRTELSLRLFKVARHHVPVSFAISFVAFVTQQNAEIHATAVRGLWEEVNAPLDGTLQSCQALLLAGVWLSGEFPQHLINNSNSSKSSDVASTLSSITMNAVFNTVKQYGLTALMKLATKYPDTKPLALSVFDVYASNLDCELQQRSCEYTTMLDSFADAATFSFSTMPEIVGCDEEVADAPPVGSIPSAGTTHPAASTAPLQQQHVSRSTIDDLFGGPAPAAPAQTPKAPAAASPTFSTDDLFGPGPTTPAVPTPMSTPVAAVVPQLQGERKLDVADLFSGGGGGAHSAPPNMNGARTAPVPDVLSFSPPVRSNAPSQQPVAPPPPSSSFAVFDCEDCSVVMSAVFRAPDTIDVDAALKVASASSRLRNVAFHVAVPRTSTVEVQPLAVNEAGGGGTVLQKLTVRSTDPAKVRNLMLRVKLVYSKDGAAKEHLFQVSKDI